MIIDKTIKSAAMFAAEWHISSQDPLLLKANHEKTRVNG
jgi:hypothetical protein